MKAKTLFKLLEDVSGNIIINDLNSQSYVSKILLNQYIGSFKAAAAAGNIELLKYYFNEIKRILSESFNLTLKVQFNQIEFKEV